MHLVSVDAYMLKGIEVRIPLVNFKYLNWHVIVEGLECVTVVDARMNLDKMSVSYYAMCGYWIITRSSQ